MTEAEADAFAPSPPCYASPANKSSTNHVKNIPALGVLPGAVKYNQAGLLKGETICFQQLQDPVWCAHGKEKLFAGEKRSLLL